jgi:hypothetical protein
MNGVSVDGTADCDNHIDGDDKKYRRYIYNVTYRCVYVASIVVGI